VLDYLAENGLKKRPVVIYTSDNGFFLGDHGWYNKMWMYEQSMRIPMLVRWPGAVKAGSISDALVCNVDLAATFLDLAGRPEAFPAQGRSLIPVLRGEQEQPLREALYYHYNKQYGVPTHFGILTHCYKLIHYPESEKWALFALKRDPHELSNLYPRPGPRPIASPASRKGSPRFASATGWSIRASATARCSAKAEANSPAFSAAFVHDRGPPLSLKEPAHGSAQ
jgi:arylsulfatase A-like enzyme